MQICTLIGFPIPSRMFATRAPLKWDNLTHFLNAPLSQDASASTPYPNTPRLLASRTVLMTRPGKSALAFCIAASRRVSAAASAPVASML